MKHLRLSSGIILALAILLTPGFPALAQNETTVQITPAMAQISVGNTTELQVTVSNVRDLYGVELTITYDPTIIEIVDAQPDKAGVQVQAGGFLSPDFEAINEVNSGVIRYALTQVSPRQPVSGGGTLLKFTVKGITDGKSPIQITRARLADPNGNGLPNTQKAGIVIVGNGNTVIPPVPTIPPTVPPTAPPTAAFPTPTEPPSSSSPPTPSATPVPAPWSEPPKAIPTGSSCGHLQGHHIVQPGETLYSIGRAYATYPRSIATCNHVLNPAIIYAGVKLAIPYAPWIPVPAGPVANPQFTPESSSFTCRNHIVRRGETLLMISWRYGVDIWILSRLNHLSNPNLIYAGQTLCLP